MVQHARLPRLLNGFQPVEYGCGDRDRVLEPLRHTLLLFHLTPKNNTSAFAWAAKDEGYPRFYGESQANGEGLGGGEDLFVGAAVKGELVPMATDEHGAPCTPVLFWAEKHQLLSAIFAGEDDLLLERTLHEFTSFALSGLAFMSYCCASG